MKKVYFLIMMITILSCDPCGDTGGNSGENSESIIFSSDIEQDGTSYIFTVADDGLGLEEIEEGLAGNISSETFCFTRSNSNSDSLFVYDGVKSKFLYNSTYPDSIINPLISNGTIYFAEGQNSLVNYQYKNGGTFESISNKLIQNSRACLSNDGNNLVFFEYDNNQLSLKVINTNNQLVRNKILDISIDKITDLITNNSKIDFEASWSHDDKFILLSGKSSNGLDLNYLLEYDWKNDKLSKIDTKSLIAINPIFIRDNNILFTNISGAIWVYHKSTKQFKMIFDVYQNEYFIYNHWSSDNNSLLTHLVSLGNEKRINRSEKQLYKLRLSFDNNTVEISDEKIISNNVIRAFWIK